MGRKDHHSLALLLCRKTDALLLLNPRRERCASEVADRSIRDAFFVKQ